MRNPDRITPILDELGRLWRKQPDMRLGQLVVAAAGTHDPFYIEDDVMLQKLREACDSASDTRAK